MLGNRAQVLLGRVALAVVGGVALHDRAVQLGNHRSPEIGMQEVLVAHLAGVNLDGNLTGQLNAQHAIEFHDLLRRNGTGEIHLGFVGHD